MVSVHEYATESEVYDEVGFTRQNIIDYTKKSSSEVTTLVEAFISDAEAMVRQWINIPITVRRENHYGDGEKFEFELGPWEMSHMPQNFDPNQPGYVEDVVERVFAVYFNGTRKKLPYPKNCKDLTNGVASSWGGDATVTDYSIADDEDSKFPVKCGTKILKTVFTAGQYIRYPSGQDWNRNIDIFDYVTFRILSTSTSPTFEVRLYDKDGHYNYKTFTLDKANVWYVKSLKIDKFTKSGSGVDWESNNCYYLEIHATVGCDVYLSNLAFNDEWIYTAPYGVVVYCFDEDEGETTLSDNYPLEVTYNFDPFGGTVPRYIKSATAKIAGVKLIEHLVGVKHYKSAFEFAANTLDLAPDRDVLLARKRYLMEQARQEVAQYGYGYFSGLV